MFYDRKFYWLVFASLLVTVFEFLSLSGYYLPPQYALPFFLAISLVIGYHTLYEGARALVHLQFKSIQLLMLLSVVGAFYLGKYEEAAVVIVLFTLAEKLEEIGISKSKSALNVLISKMPKLVSIRERSDEIPVSKVIIGDVLLVKPGMMIALDGKVVKGSSSVDESTITGEPIPQDKHIGDTVFAGTLNQQGFLEVEVTKAASDTILAKIQEMTFHATKTKAKTQRFIESFSRYYTPLVILLALGVVLYPTLYLGQNFHHWLLEGLTLLVISCPCALVISTPISIYSAIGSASSQGVLIKGGKYLEIIGQVKALAFDKTRTLTLGRPRVTDVIPFGNSTRQDLLSCAAGIELFSEHPLSQSIVEAAQQESSIPHEVKDFQSIVGKGVKAECLVCADSHHCIGKLQFILEEHKVPPEVLQEVTRLQQEGKTVIVVSTHKEVEGIIAFSDTLRPESESTIQKLQEMGIHTVMLTGDHETPAAILAKKLNIPEVHAELLPQDKAAAISKLLQKYPLVGMVGDGVNDAPALALSSVGISMSALGSDAAIEASSIVLLNDRIERIPNLIHLGRKAIRTIKINTFWAISVKVLFIALALMGRSNLALAIFADVGVTVLVILNSLRLFKEP